MSEVLRPFLTAALVVLVSACVVDTRPGNAGAASPVGAPAPWTGGSPPSPSPPGAPPPPVAAVRPSAPGQPAVAAAHPLPIALAQRTTPTKSGTPLRIPEHTDLERIVTLRNGQRVSVRQALHEVDPNEKHRLKNGKEVTLQQLIDAIESLEKQSNTRLSTSFRHVPMAASTQAKMDQSHAALTQEKQHRRELEAAGWKALIERSAGSARAFSPNAPRSDSPPPVAGSRSDAATAKKCPKAQSDPLDLNWHQQWGDPSVASAGILVHAGNEYACSPKGEPVSSCGGDATADVNILDQPFEIVRSVALANASTDPDGSHPFHLSGDLSVYVLGQKTPVWERTGQVTLPKTEQTFSTPDAQLPVPIIGPLLLNLDAKGIGTIGISAGITPNVVPGRSIACTATVTPYMHTELKGGATLELAGLVDELVQVLLGSFSAGVTADMTVIDVSLPSNLSLQLNVNPSTKMPSTMDETADVGFKATLLAGIVQGSVTIDAHWWLEPVLWAFGLDNETYEITLAKWDGEPQQFPLVGPKTHTIKFGN